MDKLCEVVLPAGNLANLTVRRSNRTGTFLFLGAEPCNNARIAFDCLTGASQDQEVVAASAVSFTDAPAAPDPTYALDAPAIAANPFLAGAGRPRPEATYAYATPVEPQYERSTERGRFRVVPFNWQVGARHRLPAWQRAGLATRYSPNGEAVEEKDILDVYSTVKMGYQAQALPYLTAKNAGFNQVYFEAFETMAPGRLVGEGQYAVVDAGAAVEGRYVHSGNQSLQLNTSGGTATLTLPAFPAAGQGMQCKLWLRVSNTATPAQALAEFYSFSVKNWAIRWAAGQDTPLKFVAQSGEWVLVEATLAGSSTPATYTPQLVISNLGARTVWVDDVRLQPAAAQMTCYVYDPKTLKLLASFDDQHFGLYYQYNAEGKLVRKQIETERGLRTVQETQYNSPAPD